MNQITDLLHPSITSYSGYPATQARLPYVVARPLLLDPMDVAVDGTTYSWDYSFSLYCCGGSVEASFNLSKLVVSQLSGQYVGGSTLAARVGYVGAAVEGHYESQVTIEITQGVV